MSHSPSQKDTPGRAARANESAPEQRGEGMPTPFILSAEQADEIEACLDWMAYESGAHCIILADRNGRLISDRGWTDQINTQILSALAAGELAATNEMARLVGEKARFKLLLHEGERRSIYLSDVGEQLIMVVVFNVAVPIGMVRMLLKEAVERLEPILERSGEEQAQMGDEVGEDFTRLLGDEINALF